jgi:hypothetical protein
MAQKMIELQKLEIFRKNELEKFNLIIKLSKSKNVTLRYSKNYKELVIAFDINRSKKLLIPRNMWKILYDNSKIINDLLIKKTLDAKQF